MYVRVPACIYCSAPCTGLSSIWVRLRICHCASVQWSVWQMSPSPSAGTLSGEVQISAHRSIGNHAQHLDERQAPATWLTGILTWRKGYKHHRHGNIKTTGNKPHPWYTETCLDTQNKSLHIKSSSFTRSPGLNSVSSLYPWLISFGYVTEEGTGCYWSCTNWVLLLITQTQDSPSWLRMFYCPLQR